MKNKFLATMSAPQACFQVCLLLILLGISAHAKTTAWQGTGSWSDSANWDNGVPVAGDTVSFGNGFNGNSTQDIANLTINTLDMDVGSAYTGTLTLNQSLTVAGSLIADLQGTLSLNPGNLTIMGDFSVSGTSSLQITGTGVLDIEGDFTTTPGSGILDLATTTLQCAGATINLGGVDTWIDGTLQIDRNGSVSIVPAPIQLPALRVLTGGGGIVTFTAATTIAGVTSVDSGVFDLNRAHTFTGHFNIGDSGSVTGSTRSQTVTFNGGITVGAGTGGSLNLNTAAASGGGTGLDLVFSEGTVVTVNNGASFIVAGRSPGGNQTILRDQDAIGSTDANKWMITRVGNNTVTFDSCRIQDCTASVTVTASNSTNEGGNNTPIWVFTPKITRWILAAGNGTWSTPRNWTNGSPGEGDTVEFNNVGTGFSTYDLNSSIGVLNMNAGGNAYRGTLSNNNAMTITGNTTIRGTFHVGANVTLQGGSNDFGGTTNTSIYELNATGVNATTNVTGTINVATGGQFNVANNVTINGTVTTTGSALVDIGGNLSGIGSLNGTGNINVAGSTVNTSGLTVAMTGGTFTLDRSATDPVTFNNGAGNHFFNLSIATTGITTPTALLDVDNNLSISGSLALNTESVLVDQDLLIDGGTLSGTGTIFIESGTTTITSSATLQPGGSAGIGTLTFEGYGEGCTLNNPTIEIDLQSDSIHDVINLGNSEVGAAGTANLKLNATGPINSFTGTPITIITGIDASTSAGGIIFENITFGDRILTADGKLSFMVNGSATSETITLELPVLTNAGHVENLLTSPGGYFEGETDPAIIGFDADPDGDGVVNVYELWFGTDPTNLNSSPVYSISPITMGADVFAALDVTVASAIDDVLLVEGFINEDLSEFGRGTRSVLSEAGGQRSLRFLSTSAITSGRAFGRLQADPNAIKP